MNSAPPVRSKCLGARGDRDWVPVRRAVCVVLLSTARCMTVYGACAYMSGSVPIDVPDGLSKGLGRLLRQIVTDTALH
jgi:hypothetical protein